MDLTMRLKRLPIDKNKAIIDGIRASIFDSSSTNTDSTSEKRITTSDETNIEVDLNDNHVLSEEEYRLVTKVWSKGETLDIPEMTIHKAFEEQVFKSPHKTAITFSNQSLSYEELNNKANQLANYLKKQGVESETFVAIYLERSLDMIISVLAILKAGGAYIPIDPAYPEERISHILSDSQAKIIITDKQLQNKIVHLKSTSVLVYEELAQISSYPIHNLNTYVDLKNLAYIIYTSGSTGIPKGVQIEHQSLINFIFSISKDYEITNKDTVMQFASLGFDVSVFDIFVSLGTGATLCIANEVERKSPEQFTELMQMRGVTVAELPPALLPLLNPDDFPSLRLVSVGGEKFSGDLVSKWASTERRFMNGYGPTETTVAVTLFDCKGQWNKNPPIGRPIYNVEAYVLNNELKPVPVGTPGELHIGGKCLARGYLNREDLTTEKFVRNPFNNDSKSRIYKTGDLVRWLRDGNLEILGRVDRQIKIRGFRVELEEIETAILEYPNIRQTTVGTFDDVNRDRQLIAYIVLDDQNTFNMKKLRESLAQKIPKYMIPARFIEIQSIPLTPNGKVDHNALPKPDDSRPDDDSYVEPRNEIELRIANDIFSPILGIKQIGATDNFFDLGGNSLQATLVISQVRKSFGIDVNLIDFFQSPIVESLAELVKQKEEFNDHKRIDVIRELNEIEHSWIKVHKEPEARIRIVCFPYAGASSYLFKKWPEMLAPDIEIVTIDLPGHGTKIKEQPFDSAFDVANRLASELETLSDKPLIFLGHSGGSILAFETARLLLNRGINILKLFALASRAPHAELKEPPRYHLPEAEFLTRVNEFGGLSQDMLNNKELLSLMIPTMRADEKLAETYLYSGKLNFLPFPISIYGGREDRIDPEDLKEWRELSTIECEFKLFDGGHFFLQENEDVVLYSIVESIAQYAY
ncbi:amino acid adenylation domain-containing protein [Peribacillus frigoritolerans]|uniref:amino acid adenylation domain-containing protein n=1 Tax=Peribacillus frigoritolerans TaxID=450367 RepID=UPI002EC48259|nr:amino acid adenylation domain-containing protein [Peribacillus frigoritolerans]